MNSVNYERVHLNGVFYDVQVDNGTSWRDCPFFKVIGCTDWLIGDLVAAKAWLELHKG